jgi:hypothetical protein
MINFEQMQLFLKNPVLKSHIFACGIFAGHLPVPTTAPTLCSTESFAMSGWSGNSRNIGGEIDKNIQEIKDKKLFFHIFHIIPISPIRGFWFELGPSRNLSKLC